MDDDRWVFRLLSPIPLSVWQAMSRMPLIIPYYHIVTDEDAPHVKHLYGFRSVKQFRDDLEFFLANYVPVGLHDVIKHLNGEAALPDRCFLLTFDDGFREMHDVVAPILRQKGVPATFFLISSCVDNRDMVYQNKLSVVLEHCLSHPESLENPRLRQLLDTHSIPGEDLASRLLAIRYRQKELVEEIAQLCGCDLAGYLASARPYMTTEQVRSLLKQGFTIGAHSVDHPLYSEVSLKDQLFQTKESLRYVVERFQLDYRAFAFPHSDNGVGPEFYKRLCSQANLDVSFGTGGMAKHFHSRNLERFTMEKTVLPAWRVVAKQYPRALYRNLISSNSTAH